MSPAEAHYSQQSQRQQQWPPHLLPAHTHQGQSSFPSPVSPPSSSISEHGQQYPAFYHQQPGGQNQDPMQQHHLNRTSSSLSLNLSSLTVASPTNLSPINPPSSHSAANLSPVTPISPSTSIQQNPFGSHHNHHPHHMQSHSPFQFSAPEGQPTSQHQNHSQQNSSGGHYDHDGNPQQYDRRGVATPTTSRSSSSSSTSISISLPRKRSFTSNNAPGGSNPSSSSSISTGTVLEESMYDDAVMDITPGYDDMYNGGAGMGTGGGGSPIDGSTSGGEESVGANGPHPTLGIGNLSGMAVGGTMNILGKPMATNNFVTKLYQ